jgi:hypothetical protein
MMTTTIKGGHIPPKEHAKLIVEDEAEYILDRLIFHKEDDRMPIDARQDCLFKPEDMRPMWVATGSTDNGRGYFHHEEVNSPSLVWPLNFGFVFHIRNDAWGDHLLCSNLVSLPPHSMRGKVMRPSKYMMALSQGYLHRENKWASVRMYGAWHFGRWIDAGVPKHQDHLFEVADIRGAAPIYRFEPRQKGDTSVGDLCAIGQSMALTFRYEWGAQFSIDGSPKIIIPTTPQGVLELFNDRNKPQDKDRRAALRHWVRQHSRKKKRGDFAGVREHLRGEVSFQWRGFDVTIRPSDFDEERNMVVKSA